MKDEWIEDAACHGVPGWAVFPRERGEDEPPDSFKEHTERHAEHLRPVCAVCPVAKECFTYSMARRIPHGVWAGVGEYTRTRWLKSGRRWRCESCDAVLDPAKMMADQALKLCDRCADRSKRRKGK